MRRTPLPRVEQLEDRTTPANFGFPWPNPGQITVSFVPDGTSLGGSWDTATGTVWAVGQSAFFSAMNGKMPVSVWQGEVLRALQTWAAEVNINLVVVPDSGDPFGATGVQQGDPRFGDIRIGAAPLSGSVLAASVPYSLSGGTWVGDIIFNTNYQFSLAGTAGYDLYTAALQEAGHVFGVGNSPSTDSVMYENYIAPRQGLGSPDRNAIHALYSNRPADAFEGTTGNDTPQAATQLRAAALQTWRDTRKQQTEDTDVSLNALVVLAEVSAAGDADVYRHRTVAGSRGLTVRVQAADLSQLRGKVSVLDGSGKVLAQGVADGPGKDLVVTADGVAGNTDCYIRVEGAGGVWSVGRYRLVVETGVTVSRSIQSFVDRFLKNMGSNDELSSATRLQAMSETDGGQALFGARGRISTADDVDYYQVRVARDSSPRDVVVVGTGGVGLAVLDSRGKVLLSKFGSGSVQLSLDSLRAGEKYYLAVTGEEGVSYGVALSLGDAPETAPVVASGVITQAQSQQFRGVLVPQSSVMHLDVAVAAPAATRAPTSVQLTLFDGNARVVYRRVVATGQSASVDLFLPAGAYTLRLMGGVADGSALPDIGFEVRGQVLSDPIGPRLVDPGAPAVDLMVTWYTLGFVNPVALVDMYGNPVNLVEPPPVVTLPPGLLPPADTTPVPFPAPPQEKIAPPLGELLPPAP